MAIVSATAAAAGTAGGGCHAGMRVVESRASAAASEVIVAATSGTIVSAT
jgi:hypothetical protein